MSGTPSIPREQVLGRLRAAFAGSPTLVAELESRFAEALSAAGLADKPGYSADEVDALSRAIAAEADRRFQAEIEALRRLLESQDPSRG